VTREPNLNKLSSNRSAARFSNQTLFKKMYFLFVCDGFFKGRTVMDRI
jgi:hypothetical protein